MTIKKEGVLFKLIYGPEWFRDWAASDIDWFEAPEKTNVCCLFWRMILSIFLIYPLIIFFGSITCACVLLVAAIVIPLFWLIGLLFCHWIYPDSNKDSNRLFKYKKIENWPLTFQGHQVYPISIIALLTILTGLVWSFVKWWDVWLVGFASLGFLALIIYFLPSKFAKIRNSEFWQLIKAYWKAKKEKVCPIVTFE